MTKLASAGQAHYYDVTPDGQRFLMRVQNPASPAHEIEITLNWFEVVKAAELRAGGN